MIFDFRFLISECHGPTRRASRAERAVDNESCAYRSRALARLALTGQAVAPVAALALFLAAALPASGQTTDQQAPRIEPALRQRLERIDRRAAEVEDLTAAFEQRKFTPLLREPLVSRGRVLVVGRRSRWETAEPRRSIAVIDPERVRIYYPRQETVEVYQVGERLRGAVASPLPRLDRLLEHFHIEHATSGDAESPRDERERNEAGDTKEENVLRLRLTPLDEAIREHVERIEVALDTRTGLAERVAWRDPDGERTVMTFTEPRINRGLDAADLDLDLPPGTQVVHPLRGVEGD